MANTPITTTSKQFTLNVRDIVKGFLVAIITPVLTVIMDSLNEGTLTFDWKKIAITALIAGIAYVIKNFLTPSEVTIKNPALAEKVKDGEAEVKVISNERI